MNIKFFFSITAIIIFYLTIIDVVSSHSYLCSPTSRSNQCAYDRGQRGLGPCDALYANRVTPALNAKRGDSIDLQWPRNNHPGGFIRVSWAKSENSDSQNAFDENIIQYSCHETPCSASNQATVPCTMKTYVPEHLSDGLWTLQWIWYGGGFGLADYYSCVDYSISGGKVGEKPTPTFHGSDVSTSDVTKCGLCDGCTDVPLKCKAEPCLPGLSGTGGPMGNGAVLDSTGNGGTTPTPTTPTTPAEGDLHGNQNTNCHYINKISIVDPTAICNTLAEGKFVCDSETQLGTCSNGRYYKISCAPNTHCSNGFCVSN